MLRMGCTAPILGTRFWEKDHAGHQSRLSHFTYQQSMDIIMESFWDLNLSGFMKDIDGESRRIVPLLLFLQI